MPSIVIFAGIIIILVCVFILWFNIHYAVVFLKKEKHKQVSTKEAFERSQDTNHTGVVSNTIESEQTMRDIHCPFVLNAELVPVFANENWGHIFYNLAEKTEILGWIAFQNACVGASNRVYDANFIHILQIHHESLNTLKKEVGLSTLQDVFIHGKEGDIWFVLAQDGVWFSLFTEHNGDILNLVNTIHESLPSHI